MYVCVCLSVQKVYQELVRSEGMIEHLVRGLKKENRELQMHCAAAIFKVCTARCTCDSFIPSTCTYMCMYVRSTVHVCNVQYPSWLQLACLPFLASVRRTL